MEQIGKTLWLLTKADFGAPESDSFCTQPFQKQGFIMNRGTGALQETGSPQAALWAEAYLCLPVLLCKLSITCSDFISSNRFHIKTANCNKRI